ncbi:YfiT family bacillithiol transferase [Membranihabitans marinus]|uniref:YfiT family bacillithiol transferase n=1 Tax=Membranihabitans marinus TaxID=1227546 RepID=UPI001F2F0ACE|nr:putative metal-dependent hydrolase [Membranihabitans marinus]
MKNLQYPIGRFQFQPQEKLSNYLQSLTSLPNSIKNIINDFTEDDWAITYRPGGWNGRQLVHHIADSHMNSFIRFKLALTEERPTIRPYYEDRWALLADVSAVHPMESLQILTALHNRWTILIESLSPEDLNKSFYHPGDEKWVTLLENTAFYAWHCDHHLAHLKLIDDKRKNQ